MVALDFPFDNYFINENGQMFRKLSSGRLRQLQGTICDTGHIKVSIIGSDGTKRKFTLARLVAERFVPNPDNLSCVSYRDGDKTNVSASNLFWDHKETNSHFSKKDRNILIRCVDTGQIFDSVLSCSKALSVSSTYVSYAIKHNKLIKGRSYEIVSRGVIQ